MSSTITLTAEERHAATFALADDLTGLAKNLREQCGLFMNAPLDKSDIHAADMVTAARMIANLLAPLELVVGTSGLEVK